MTSIKSSVKVIYRKNCKFHTVTYNNKSWGTEKGASYPTKQNKVVDL